MVLARPDWAVQAAFNADPNDPVAVPTWTDLTALVLSADGFARGKQYELDEVRASSPALTLLDPNEYLNPGNPSSPYSPNVVPYRQLLWQGMWPNGGTGNLLNASTQGTVYDPSFESYTAGQAVSWVTAVGGTNPLVGTTTPRAGTRDLTWTVVGTATVQGVSWVVPCIPGRQYTASAYVRQSSASTQRISVDGSAGTSTSTTGAYVRLTKTFTATQPTHTVQVATTGTAVAGTVLLDDVQHEPGAAATTATTAGPVIYGVTRPYVERWPSAWDDAAGFLGRCDAEAVDAFGVLAQTQLSTEAGNAILAKKPLYFWPLQEADGATAFGEQSGNSGPGLGLYASKYGGGTPPEIGTNPTTEMAGNSGGSSIKFTGDLVRVTAQQGTVLVAGLNGIPALPVGIPATPTTAWTASASVWINTTTTTSAAGMVPFVLKSSAQTGVLNVPVSFVVSGTTTLAMIQNGSGGGFLQLQATGGNTADGKWHLLTCVASQDATNSTVTLYIDGALAATNTTATSGFPLLNTSSTAAEVGGAFGLTSFGGTYDGYACYAALWNRALSPAEILDLWTAGKGYPGETTGTRIARYLSYGWTGATAIDTGQSTMGVSALDAGTSLLDACQACATSENGNFWVDSRGRMVFTSRTRRYLARTAAYVFGENTAGGELPYEGDFAYDYDPSQVNNDVSVTNTATGYIARATDLASQKRYFPRAYDRQINVSSNLEADDAATYLLATRKAAAQRVQTLTLNPAANPTLWPVVLGIELGTRVTVKRRSEAANGGAGLTQSADFFVEQISHGGIDMEAGTWITTLQLSPVVQWQVGLLDDATWGLLDSTMVLAY